MVAVDGWHLTGGNPAAEITAHFKNCGTLDDELMPACTMQMHYALPNTHVTMFPNARTCHSSRNPASISPP